MGNNIDMVEVNRRALLLLEQVFISEPYASMPPDQQSEIRKQLLPSYLKMEFDREVQEEQARNPPLPTRPPFDPAVASALIEQNRTLGQLKVETQHPEFNLNTLERKGLTLKQQNDLSQMVKPLSTNFKLPCKQDLSSFWRRAERALKGLGAKVDVRMFGPEHIEVVGPVLLGEAVWELYQNERFDDWEEFQQAIERRFGLTKRQLLDAFDSMRPSPTESEAEFILRVEDKRAKLGQDQEFCVRHFLKLLSLDYRRELKRLRRVLRRSGDDSPLTWVEIVEDARDALEYNHLTPEDTAMKIQGFAQQETLSPEAGQIAVQNEKDSSIKKKNPSSHLTNETEDLSFATHTSPNNNLNKTNNSSQAHTGGGCKHGSCNNPSCNHTSGSHNQGNHTNHQSSCNNPSCNHTSGSHNQGNHPNHQSGYNNRRSARHCPLCALLGRTNPNSHNLSECYANPLNPGHNPEIVFMRYKQLKNVGIELPECLREYDLQQQKLQEQPNPIEEKGPEVQKTTKIDRQLIYQLDQDFQQLIKNNGGNSEAAFSGACLANLGYLIEDVDEPTKDHHFMYKDDHDDVQAATQNHPDKSELIKQHLIALQRYSDAEVLAVQDEMEVDLEKKADQGSDDSSDSDDDEEGGEQDAEEGSDDDLPISNLKRTYATAGAQTGGVRSAGRMIGRSSKGTNKPKASTQDPTLGSQVNKLKILLPLFKGLAIKSNLRKYILAQAVLEAHQQHEKVTVVKGTKVREIDPEQMKEEIKVYSESGVDDEDKVRKQLKEIKKRYAKSNDTGRIETGNKRNSSNYLAEIIDSMKLLLDDSPHTGTADRSFLNVLQDRKEYKLPEGARGLPSWAPNGAKNARGVCSTSSSHYLGLASVDGAFLEVTLDSGGGRTMIDESTARRIGLDIEWAEDTKKHYGTFSGVSGSSCQYLGVTRRPVHIQFAEDVCFRLKEIKVFKYPEPILLIGTDLLSFAPNSDCTFSYLGVNPLTNTGEVVFYNRTRKELIACELVHSPTTHSALPQADSIAAKLKKVKFQLDQKEQQDSPANQSANVAALIMNRGQRL